MVFIGPAHHIELTKAALAKAIGYYHERPAASFLQGTFHLHVDSPNARGEHAALLLANSTT